jgi:two-component system, sensor histidine kinase and response regulator
MTDKPTALIIEDNEDQNLVFTTALHQAGYEAESIHDGQAAQQRLAEIEPDMVILDLHIPGISGKNLLDQIRRDPRLSKTRVILATADSGLASSLEPQADLVLLKPISFSQLSQLVARFLRHDT